MSEPVKTAAAPVRVAPAAVRAPVLARKCACGGGAGASCKCPEEEPRGSLLHRKAAEGGARTGRVPDIVRSVLSSPGRPLESDTRAMMESRFGHDFAEVRIHTGAAAAASARAVGARAYTIGNDIVLAAGHDTRSPRGLQLLAHELTHTIQQRGVPRVAFENLPISSPEQSCEREADAIAHAVMTGDVVRPSLHGAPVMLARQAESETPPVPGTDEELLRLHNIEPQPPLSGADAERIRWFHVKDPFPVPAEKGPRALPFWKGRAAEDPGSATALHMIVTARGPLKPVLKAKRSSTNTLRQMWLIAVGWPADPVATVTERWNTAGGTAKNFFERSLAPADKPAEADELLAKDPADAIAQPEAAADPNAPPKPSSTDRACQFDHVVELQAGGPDVPSNLAVISGSNNVRSAVKITAEIRKRIEQIRQFYPKLEQAGLVYSSVEQEPAGACGTSACCNIEENARKQQAQATPIKGGEEVSYLLTAGNFSHTAIVPKDTKTEVDFANSHPVNAFGVRLVPGFVFQKLSNRDKPTHQIEATVDTTSMQLITLKGVTTAKLAVIGGKIEVSKAKPHIGFTFPYLSEGTITKFALAEDGLHSTGTIAPSFPLLKGSLLDFELTPSSFIASLKPKTPLKSPIPGLELIDPKISLPLLPEFKPTGSVGFALGKNLVTGTLQVGADGTDFVATADVTAHIPGLDDAGGKVRYHRRDGWSSQIHLEKSTKQFVKRAAVDVNITDAGLDAKGTIDVEPPGGSKVLLTIGRDVNGVLHYTGEGDVVVPGLADPVHLELGYSQAGLLAKGTAPFKLKALGAQGMLTLSYDPKLGFIGTIHDFSFKRGLATVKLHKLTLANQKFTGSGEITLPVGKNLLARGAVTLDEKENLNITAALKIAKPITLFDAFGGNYTLFLLPTIKIPIPGASIAGFGLKLQIEGGLYAGYRIGPGTIEEAEIAAGINPLQTASTAGVTLKARLLIPATASVTGKISGLVALDAYVAEVAGGVTVSATAALKGGLDAQTQIGYSPERLVVDAELNAALALMLTLGLDAVVRASVLTKKYEKVWELGRWPFDPGVKFNIGAQFHYESDKPFKAPTLTFNKPALDGERLVSGPFGGAAPKEKNG